MKIRLSLPKIRYMHISYRYVIWFLIMIVFFESTYLTRYYAISLTYAGLKLLGVALLLVNIKRFRISWISVIIVLREFSVLLSTYLAGNGSFGYLVQAMSSILFVLLLDYMLYKDAEKCISVVYAILEILVYLNFLSMILFPAGLYNLDGNTGRSYYFLGHQNNTGIYVVVCVVLSVVLSYLHNGKKKFSTRGKLLIIVGIISIVRVWSALSLLGFTMLITLLIYDRFSKKGWIIPIKSAIIINLVLFFVIVIEQNFNVFSWLIQTLLHRDLTLSGRTNIWTIATKHISENLLFGMGEGQGKAIFNFTTTHNRYLNELFVGGVFGGALFIIQLILIAFKIEKRIDHLGVSVINIFFWTILFMFQAETYANNLILLMLVLGYHIEDIIAISKNKCISYSTARMR